MRRTLSAPRARLIRLLVCLSLLAQSQLPTPAVGAGKAASPANRVSAPRGVEAADLPDLDEARSRPRHEPKAVPPIPSTRRRCPPRNPRCNDADGGAPRPTPAPTPRGTGTASAGRGEHFLAGLTAPSWLELKAAAVSGRPAVEVPELDYYLGGWHSASDSPGATGLLPLAASPAPALFQSARTNVALAANGGVAVAVPDFPVHPNHSLSALNDGDRKGPGHGGIWADATSNQYPDWVQIDFNGAKAIDEVAVFSVQNNGFTTPGVEPTQTMTGSQYVVTSFEVHYRVGAAWVAIPGGGVTGNNLIWRRVTFPEVVTTGVRVRFNATADNYSQVPEVEVWGVDAAPRVNHALWAGAAASSQYSAAYPAAAAVNGDRLGLNWGAGGGWTDATSDQYPDWLEVDFGGERRVDEVQLFGIQEAYASPAEPSEAMTSRFAPTDFLVQYWTGSGWVTVQGGAVTNNNKVWRRFTFPGVTTRKVRVSVTRVAGDNRSALAELEAWGPLDLPTGTGLTGEYYAGDNFEEYRLTRPDATVNFDWGSGSPHSSVPNDFFTARWTGMVVPRHTETYTFHATSDDGVRLWVDGQLLINQWTEQAPTEATAQVALQAGRAYTVRMEFFEHWGGAQALLQWSSASQTKQVVPRHCLYGCWKAADQFTKDLYQGALGRQPSTSELQDWAGRLNQAQGEAQFFAEARDLGAQLFTSAEYAARNRADAEYVADLYRAYMQRPPDAGGLSYWTGQITACGTDPACRAAKRVDVRVDFAQSPEFGEKVRNLCGTAYADPANGGAGYNFTTARLDPSNRTGGGGVDAYSRNFNFQIPLVSLPGRAGLDLGLVLSYNSLVWTKDATGVTFDADQGFPSPGFRLGFPVIEPKFVNPQLRQEGQPTRSSYLLVTPGGARVELRQVGTSNVYESADSSYLQLHEGEMTLVSTDGTRLSFVLLNGTYRCAQVMDRNGNYLSVAYYGDGRLWKVTDTLGRTVTFNYDNFQNLASMTQPWKRETEESPWYVDETHEWATFGFGDPLELQPLFDSDLGVIGEQPGAEIPVLRQVGLSDGSYYRFEYNEWGQVWKVTRYAADAVNAQGQPNFSHPLTSTRLDLPGSDLAGATAQGDCPRFEEARTWVEHGVRDQSVEVTTSYSTWSENMASCTITPPDPTPESTSDDVTVHELYETSLWGQGLTKQSEVRAGGQTKKTTTLTWEHDGGSAAYPTNPRVTQTSITDPLTQPQARTRTTKVTYTVPADFQGESGYAGTLNLSLPKKVEECADGNCSPASEVLRTTVTDYKVPNLARYVERRILGLARHQLIYDGADADANLRAKVGYVYDEANVTGDTFLAALPSAAAQHDGAYAVVPADPDDPAQPWVRWRGNANRVRRYSVDQTGGAVGSYVESRAAYNVTGALAYTKDAAGHKTSLGYADAFFQNVNRTHTNPQHQLKTYAYPTSVTDADNFTASTLYNYDMGAATKTKTPNVLTTQPHEPEVTRLYDRAGRVIKTKNSVNAAHTEWVYDPSMKLVKSFTTISDASAQNQSLRHYSVTALDGAGRVRGTARDFDGSATVTPAGNYSAQVIHYDEAGRAVFRSNPTEMRIADGEWKPAGDDANGGLWKGTTQEYDWKGRPTRIINPDDETDRLFEYGGCGCAGGEVVTVRGELVPTFEPAPAPAQGRRTQRVYMDELGRVKKTEALNWNGSVHSATTTKYDALDRPLRVRRYAGAAPGQEPVAEGDGYQTTTMTYDGHGRLLSQRLPKYEPGTATTYEYDADDVLLTTTDPRGVVTTYGYTNAADYTNKRHLVNSVTYSNAPAGVPVPEPARFEYDAMGNRTSMTDEAGSLTYRYDALSRLASETRQFDGITHRTYTLTYGYNLVGQLKSMTDEFGHTTTYGRDKAGQVTEVTGSGYPAIPQLANGAQFASGLKYRAWGAVSAASYGDGRGMTADYDSRLRITGFHMPGPLTLDKAYQYEADGALRFADDLVDDIFDRSYSYDHGGRLAAAHTGAQARGGTADDGPYQQTYTHDPFGHVTEQTNVLWKQPVGGGGGTYQNDRRQGWNYDAAGNLTYDQLRHYVNDAAGRMRSFNSGVQTYAYDGEGQVARVTRQLEGTFTVYNLRSTALGGAVVSQLKPQSNGLDVRDDIIQAGGAEVRREVGITGERVAWAHEDPAGTTVQEGGLTSFGGPNATFYSPIVQLDAVRASVGTFDPAEVEQPPPPPDETSPEGPVYSNPWRPGQGCAVQFLPMPCAQMLAYTNWRAGGMRVRRTETDWSFRVDIERTGYAARANYFEDGEEIVGVGTYAIDNKGRWEFGTRTTYEEYMWGSGMTAAVQTQNPYQGATVTASASPNDPCAGNKGKIDPNTQGGLKEGIQHVSDRHIYPQGARWRRGTPDERSFFDFGSIGTKGNTSITKSQKEDIVMNMLQEAFEKGAANRLSGGDYAYSYAPPVFTVNTPLGPITGTGYIGVDRSRNWDYTNVRTVVLDVTDCQHPILSTGYPGLARPRDSVNGSPIWKPVNYVLR